MTVVNSLIDLPFKFRVVPLYQRMCDDDVSSRRINAIFLHIKYPLLF